MPFPLNTVYGLKNGKSILLRREDEDVPALVAPEPVVKLSPPYEEYDTALLGGSDTLSVLMRRRLAVRPGVLLLAFVALLLALLLLLLLLLEPFPFPLLLVFGDALEEDAFEPASPSILSTPENGSASLPPAMLGGTQFWLR